MITRRTLVIALGAGLLTAPFGSFAQQSPGKIPRIGYLALRGSTGRFTAFRQGLAELGYVEGKTIMIERRSAEGRAERLPGLAAELAGRKVDVLVALDPRSSGAAISATRTIPIVMRTSLDPVAAGIVASLAHPGGNVTGLFSLYSELNGKRLELLKQAFPTISRVMLLWDPTWPGEQDRLRVAVDSARKLGLHPLPAPVNKAGDFESAFKAAAHQRASGLLVLRTPLMVMNTALIITLAASARLLAIYDEAAYVEAGGLMSYGASLTEIDRRAAYYVDKILKGAKPGDLPIEQPTKFELVVNMKTAKALGITFPNTILLRVDKTIE
jgi:putative ABC transport system substrate-binding protein